jgi:hypothetical protein
MPTSQLSTLKKHRARVAGPCNENSGSGSGPEWVGILGQWQKSVPVSGDVWLTPETCFLHDTAYMPKIMNHRSVLQAMDEASEMSIDRGAIGHVEDSTYIKRGDEDVSS